MYVCGTHKQCVTVSFNNNYDKIYDIIVYVKGKR